MDEETLIESRNAKRYKGVSKLLVQDGFGVLTVEKNALLIMKVLKIDEFERTRDVIQILYESPLLEDEACKQELIVLVTAEEYQFRLTTTEWTKGGYEPVTTSYLFKRLILKNINSGELEQKIIDYLNLAVNKMKANLRVCKYCKRKFIIEDMINNNVCHGCASEYGRVIF